MGDLVIRTNIANSAGESRRYSVFAAGSTTHRSVYPVETDRSM